MNLPLPNANILEKLYTALEPWRAITHPLWLGEENLPTHRPLMLVGNHTIYGIYDTPVFMLEMYQRHGITLRALGDHVHFKIPVWREFLSGLGVVDGTREAAGQLMDEGQCILLFPGGAREVAKRRGERYRLFWGDRLGFARLALRHGCTVVPFSAVGGEEMLNIVYDAEELLASPAAAVVRALGVRQQALIPLAVGLGPLPLPRPKRLYFRIGQPIRAAGPDNDAQARALRDAVRAEVEAGLRMLLEERARDPLARLEVRLADAALEAAGRGLRRLAALRG